MCVGGMEGKGELGSMDWEEMCGGNRLGWTA